jgi:hypothetical protein
MKPLDRTIPVRLLRVCEWVFVLAGTVLCVWVALVFASYQSSNLWPVPGLYFLEIILVAVFSLTSRILDVGPVSIDYGLITWLAGGILLAFVILGGFSIGPSLFPAMLAFWLAAALGDVRQRRPMLAHLAWALVAALFQGALIGVILLISRA